MLQHKVYREGWARQNCRPSLQHQKIYLNMFGKNTDILQTLVYVHVKVFQFTPELCLSNNLKLLKLTNHYQFAV